MSNGIPHSFHPQNEWANAVPPPPDDSGRALHFSDAEDVDGDAHAGDYSHYSQQMEELLEDEGNESADESQSFALENVPGSDQDDEDEEEDFIYTGVDASGESVPYREQLRDILGQDHEEESVGDAQAVKESLLFGEGTKLSILLDDEPLERHLNQEEILSDFSPSPSSFGPASPPSRLGSPAALLASPRLARPFLHPNVSRLRSFTPQMASGLSLAESVTSSHSHPFEDASPSPSGFSSISRSSSISNLRASTTGGAPSNQSEVFRWSELQLITKELYSKNAPKALHLPGASFGNPTALAANGFVCVGLNDGRICVYDFKQNLKAICGIETKVGPVTTLALSHDHTCVASGHATGHIQLFNLKKPHNPIRSVPPTTLGVVATGRKEGHLQGSRIVSIGFIAGRHTALVSADEHGLAFYHSLGKMLFVEASDILRILGQYPDPSNDLVSSPTSSSPIALHKRKARYSILAMASLPLGATAHPTDAYDVVALLTPTKLVVVGLRPTPKTWFKCPREVDEGQLAKSQMKGTVAWFPSLPYSHFDLSETVQNGAKDQSDDGVETRNPILAYTWGNSLRFLTVSESRFKQRVQNTKTSRASEIEVGSIVFNDTGKWIGDETILALQWLNANQLVLVMASSMGVYDIQLSKLIERTTFDGHSLVSPTLNLTTNASMSYADSIADVAHSLRVYKGKIFILSRERLLVGTLLTWADRILALVEAGDFLGAVDLCRVYYTDQAPGNRNSLPTEPARRKEVISEKLRNLMDASVRYAFAEERLTDETHRAPDGVDRTPLFEGLVTTCCRACVVLEDFHFLFEDLFQRYDDNGITPIYLRQLEPFILDNSIHYVPPRITQCLVALHEADGQPEYVERIIWHMDPSCLDLNQTIHLCQKFHLYDALIYIYTRALQDHVAPLVELLGLIRRIQKYRHAVATSPDIKVDDFDADLPVDSLIVNAYKVYRYLSNILSGLSYPSDEPLPEDEAFKAKESLYAFLFFGRSSVWPPGDGGKLVLTAEEEGGVEPTYPYARQLLHFDSEAFLHSLDIAFEDVYLNDASRSVNRLIIVRVLLEILYSGQLSSEDVTLVNIFIARNVPKYPQFLSLHLAPTVLHNILTGLAEDPDPTSREDRQLAAEYLLSAYNPHDVDSVTSLFEEAGFYRILRAWYKQDRRWALLLCTYINDHQLLPAVLFENVHNVLRLSARQQKGILPTDVSETLADSLPQILGLSIRNTSIILDYHAPSLHETALSILHAEFQDKDHTSYVYLRQLFAPQPDEDDFILPHRPGALTGLPSAMREEFIDLQSRLYPEDLVSVLKNMDPDSLQWQEIVDICERNEAWDTVIWALNFQQAPLAALKKAESYYKQLSRRIIESLNQGSVLNNDINLLHSLGSTGRDICMERSQGPMSSEIPLEDLWFSLLSSQIHGVQTVSAVGGDPERLDDILTTLRSSVQATFTALVSITSTQAVSFPRLFKRLVNSTPTTTGTQYTEFRLILGGMLESYHSDADMLVITKHLIDRDLFETFSRLTGEKGRGWRPVVGRCSICRQSIVDVDARTAISGSESRLGDSECQVVVSRTGTLSHSRCWLIPENGDLSSS